LREYAEGVAVDRARLHLLDVQSRGTPQPHVWRPHGRVLGRLSFVGCAVHVAALALLPTRGYQQVASTPPAIRQVSPLAVRERLSDGCWAGHQPDLCTGYVALATRSP
jgi:hypothetical protein